MRIGGDVTAQILNIIAAERNLIDANADLNRNRGTKGAAGKFRDPPNCFGRRPDAVTTCQCAVEIDLAARQHAVETRLLAEFEIGDAGELEALVLRPVLEFELLHQRRGRARLDFAAQAPGLNQLSAAARRNPDRPRQTQGPVEARLAAGKRQHAVGLDAQRPIDRIDIDVELDRAVVAIAAGGHAKRIEIATDAGGALALERAEQRACFAVEPDSRRA